VRIPTDKVSRHLISRDSLNNCLLIETKYSPIIEEINAQVQMLLFIIPFWWLLCELLEDDNTTHDLLVQTVSMQARYLKLTNPF